MTRIFVFSLAAIIIALTITIFYGLPSESGYILVMYGNYTFETSLLALIVAGVVILVLLRLFYILISWINPWHLVRYGRKYRQYLRSKARSNTQDGLLYFARGNWESSHNLLSKSVKDDDCSVVNYLAAAYAANKLGAEELWQDWLERAERNYPAHRSTIKFLQAQLLFRSGQLEKSLLVLEHLQKSSLNDNALLNLLKEVYIKLEDWSHLRKLLPSLIKNNVIDTEEAKRIEKRLFMEQLYDTAESVSLNQSKVDAIKQIQKLWNKMPTQHKRDHKVSRHYSELLLTLGANDEAGKILEAAINRRWSDELVERYGEIELSDIKRQLHTAEGWLKRQAGNASLLLALGRICLRGELWDKAREYFEASLRVSPNSGAFGELGRLLKNLGEHEAAGEYLGRYMQLLGNDLPVLPLPQGTTYLPATAEDHDVVEELEEIEEIKKAEDLETLEEVLTQQQSDQAADSSKSNT